MKKMNNSKFLKELTSKIKESTVEVVENPNHSISVKLTRGNESVSLLYAGDIQTIFSCADVTSELSKEVYNFLLKVNGCALPVIKYDTTLSNGFITHDSVWGDDASVLLESLTSATSEYKGTPLEIQLSNVQILNKSTKEYENIPQSEIEEMIDNGNTDDELLSMLKDIFSEQDKSSNHNSNMDSDLDSLLDNLLGENDDYEVLNEDKDSEKKIEGIYPGTSKSYASFIDEIPEFNLFLLIVNSKNEIEREIPSMLLHKGKSRSFDEAKYGLMYLIYQTRKFGTNIPDIQDGDDGFLLTPEINEWMGYYEKHLNSLSKDELNDMITRQLAGVDSSMYAPELTWQEYKSKQERTLK